MVADSSAQGLGPTTIERTLTHDSPTVPLCLNNDLSLPRRSGRVTKGRPAIILSPDDPSTFSVHHANFCNQHRDGPLTDHDHQLMHTVSPTILHESSQSVKQMDARALDSNNRPLNFREAMKGPEATHFCEALSTELFRLLRDTKTIEWIHPTQKPADRRASYFNPQVKVKINQAGERVYRVRGTYGGNISDYTGDTYAGTADLQTFKLLCNATVSESAYLLTGDNSDFYLMNDLERPEYMWLERAHVLADVQAAYANQIIWRDNRAMV